MGNSIVKEEDAAEGVLKLLIEEKIIVRLLKIMESEEYYIRESQFLDYKKGGIIKPLKNTITSRSLTAFNDINNDILYN
jgi:hypothetical protein